MPIKTNEALKATRSFTRGDEVEIAERLIETLKARADHIVACNDAIWLYDGQCGLWSHISRETLIGEAQQFAGSMIGRGKKKRALRLSHFACKGVAECVLTNLAIAQPGFFNDARSGFAFKDKFVVCEDGELVTEDHSPDNKARHGVNYYWNPKAKFNAWRSFLASTFRYDEDAEDKRSFLQEFIGAALLGIAPNYRKCVMLEGGGSNGKSALIELSRCLFPSGSLCSIPPNRWKHEYYAADLEGKLLNTISETPSKALLASEEFKNVVAGDPLQGRHPAGRPFEFYPHAAHILSTNGLPSVSDQSDGFWDRFVVLEFNRSFKPSDSDFIPRADLDAALTADQQGILVWALRGAARLLVNGGYTLPASSGRAISLWQVTNDTVRSWIAENCEIQTPEQADNVSKVGTLASKLYRNYVNFCRKNGRNSEAIQAFGNRLRALKVPHKRTSKGIVYALKVRSGKINVTTH